jgi:hypothetical protein
VTLISGSLNVIYMQKIAKLNSERQPLSPTLLSLESQPLGCIAGGVRDVRRFLPMQVVIAWCFGDAWKALDQLALHPHADDGGAASFRARCPGSPYLRRNAEGLVYQISSGAGQRIVDRHFRVAVERPVDRRCWRIRWCDTRAARQVVSLNTIALRIGQKSGGLSVPNAPVYLICIGTQRHQPVAKAPDRLSGPVLRADRRTFPEEPALPRAILW